MACTSERSQAIADLAAGRLDEAGSGELLEHVAACAVCSSELDLVADLIAVADAQPALAAPRRRFPLRLVVPVAAAAALVLVLLNMPFGGDGDVSSLASLEPPPVGAFVPRAGATPEEDARYRAALELFAAEDYAGAAAGLESLAQERPEDPLSAFYLGVARLQIGAAAGAVTPLETAAREGEGLLRERALWYLGNAHLALERPDEALRAFQELFDLGGDYELNAREKIDEIRRLVE